MSDFRVGTIPSSSVLHMYSQRDSIWFNPPYQRMSDIWPVTKRQLLIDSIINGYDVPKLYFHEFFPSKAIKGKRYKYAIIDGKQRLETIIAFIKGDFKLDPKMEYIADSNVKPGGLTYAELARKYPDLKTKFDGFVLPIVSILTDDTELIEDMFSRLNEAVPLNAAEKRNALGGPVPEAVHQLSTLPFFKKKLPFGNARYRHFDLAAKFFYITHRRQLVDTKKVHLDEFVRAQRAKKAQDIAGFVKQTKATLSLMTKVFVNDDELLRSVGTTLLYYYLFFDGARSGWGNKLRRSVFKKFEDKRAKNRAAAEKDVAAANFHLLEYDRLSQSPNDGIALRYRYAVLRQDVGPKQGRPPMPDDE